MEPAIRSRSGERNPVGVALAPSLRSWCAALAEVLGPGFHVAAGVDGSPPLLVVTDQANLVAVAGVRQRSGPGVGIIVVLDDDDAPGPVSVVALIEAGADVCLVAPTLPGLAAHIRALAAHRPESRSSGEPCLT